MDFSFDIPPLVIGLFEASILATVVSLSLFLMRILPLRRQRRADRLTDAEDAGDSAPGASVIVYSNDQAEELSALLPQLLSQQYRPGFEVIVVNEGDSPRVRAIVEDLQMRHRNLYLTFTPDGARNLSRKKLAITLGVKAARHPVVVLTGAGASMTSDHWLSRMMRHFADSHIELVLGIAVPDTDEDSALWKRIRSFDLAVDTIAWVTDAIGGRPWRGVEYNLAYRRDTFFRNKGFSSQLNLRRGDDDIFVAEIATPDNTAVELSDESVVEVPGVNTLRAQRDRNVQRRFTRRFIRRRPRLTGALSWWAYLTAAVLPAVALTMEPHNPFMWVCASVCLVCWYLTAMVWRGAIIAMRGRHLLLTLPFIAAMRPLRKLTGAAMARLAHGKRYTWE